MIKQRKNANPPITMVCTKCSKDFLLPPSDLKYGRGKYCSRNCYTKTGESNPKWRGGKVTVGGYVYVLAPDHPNATIQGYVLEHRLVMEKKLGRVLAKDEIVHHLNGLKSDNRTENLVIVTRAKHMTIHKKGIKQTPEHIHNRFANRKPHDMSKYIRDSKGRFI